MEDAISASFEAFYRKTHIKVLGFARFHGLTREEAEDVVQETYIAVAEKWATLAEIDAPTGYVFQTCRNKMIDYRRQRTRRPEMLVHDVGENVLVENDIAAQVEARLTMESLLPTLNPREALVFDRMIDEQSVFQTARDLDVSASTVQAYRSRIRRKFRSMMNEEANDGHDPSETRKIEQALSMLTERQRSVFDLRVEGKKTKQVAEELGMSEGNVAVTMHHAGTKVAKSLDLKGPFEALEHVRKYLPALKRQLKQKAST